MQQHRKALYYTADQTIDELLIDTEQKHEIRIDARGDASHVTTPHPDAWGNLQTITFKLRYEHAFDAPKEEAPLTRYQPAKVHKGSRMHFLARDPADVLAIISDDGKVYRNKLVDEEDVDYESLINHAKTYFSQQDIYESVA